MRVSTKYSPQSGENSSGTTYRQLDRRSRRPDTRVKLMESQWVRGWPGYFRLLTRVSFHLFSFIPPFSFPPFPFNFLRNTCTMERGRLSTSFRVERAGSGGFRRGLTDKKRVLFAPHVSQRVRSRNVLHTRITNGWAEVVVGFHRAFSSETRRAGRARFHSRGATKSCARFPLVFPPIGRRRERETAEGERESGGRESSDRGDAVCR